MRDGRQEALTLGRKGDRESPARYKFAINENGFSCPFERLKEDAQDTMMRGLVRRSALASMQPPRRARPVRRAYVNWACLRHGQKR
jgi:hypothetical protein